MLKLLTYSQKAIRVWLNLLTFKNYIRYNINGNIIFIPSNRLHYALLCVHLDTINDVRDKLNPTLKELIADDYSIRLTANSPCVCLGGDDRCGVYVALQLLKSDAGYAVGFFRDEELGCKGSSQVAGFIDRLNGVTCFIGLDRKGFNECALYGYDNNELITHFKERGYIEAIGSITDASNLASLSAHDLACVNLSVGYYNEHTRQEFIIKEGYERTLRVLKDTKTRAFLNSTNKFKQKFNYSRYYSDEYLEFLAYNGVYADAVDVGDVEAKDPFYFREY